MTNLRDLAQSLWWRGIEAVHGRTIVSTALAERAIARPDLIISIGKAACAMCQGALDQFGPDLPALVVTKYGHDAGALDQYPYVFVTEASHPIPDENSLRAGQEVLDKVRSLPSESRLLLLISGGASSLVEVLHAGRTLAELKQVNEKLIATDTPIGSINHIRKSWSVIKNGGLLAHFMGDNVTSIFISDVEGDDPTIIGSGIGAIDYNTTIPEFKSTTIMAANNALAREAVALQAAQLRWPVVENSACLEGEITPLSEQLATRLLSGPDGIYIWGGEPTVALPDNPGIGGRNQSLALLLAKHISGRSDIAIIVAGTDGTDGPTHSAGGLIDGQTYRDAKACDLALATANAGPALAQTGDLFDTGPTGTNVMDLIIAVKQSAPCE